MDNNFTKVFVPTSEKVVLSTGVEMEARAFKLGQLPLVLKELNPILGVVNRGIQSKLTPTELALQLIGDSGESIMRILSVSYKLDKEQVENLDLDDAVLLLSALLEVNANFFFQKVLPQITERSEALTAKLTGAKS